jgi:hypothetical protein
VTQRRRRPRRDAWAWTDGRDVMANPWQPMAEPKRLSGPERATDLERTTGFEPRGPHLGKLTEAARREWSSVMTWPRVRKIVRRVAFAPRNP